MRISASIWFGLILTVAVGGTPVRGAELEVVHLRGGDQLRGVSRGLADGLLRWELPHGTQTEIPLDQIERIDYGMPEPLVPVPSESAAPPVSAECAECEPEAVDHDRLDSFVTRFDAAADRALVGMSDWTKRFELGARMIDGNSDNDYVDAKLLLERTTETQTGQFESGGHFAQANGDRITNRWYVNGNLDYSWANDWIWFASSRNEYDEFENLDYRSTISTGPGYRFINEKDRRLIARIGPGVTFERFSNPTVERITPDLFAEVELKFPLFDRTQFEHKTTVNPSLEDLDVLRLVSTYGILIRLDPGERWSLKFGLRHEYNSDPNVGRKRSDYTSSVLLVYTRK